MADITEKERKRRALLRKEARDEITGRMITVITTAMALVAALFWQTAITDTIKAFLPVSGAWPYEILAACVITLLSAIVIYFLTKSSEGKESKK
jgi:drug/metabolite transporter (DMT)-like permease